MFLSLVNVCSPFSVVLEARSCLTQKLRETCVLSYLDPPWLFSVPLATPSSFLPFCICVRMSIGEGLGHG